MPPGWQLWLPDEAADPGTGGYAVPGATPGYGPPGGYAAPGSTPGGGGGKGPLWAVLAVVVVLALIGGVVAILLNRGSDDAPATATAGSVAASSSGSEATSTDGTVSAPVPTTCADVPGTASDPAPLGQGSVVGDYCVALTTVVDDATATIAAESSFNDPPKNGRYILLTLSAINQGASASDAFFDLYVTLKAADGTEYKDTDCSVLVPDDLSTKGKVAPGATVTGGLCLDVPAAQVDGQLTISTLDDDTGKVFAPR